MTRSVSTSLVAREPPLLVVRPTVMRFRLLLAVLALVAAACGSESDSGIEITTTTIELTEPAPAPADPTGDRVDPGSQQASRSPEPVSEPILRPVPAPAPEPTKPSRPGLPAPPPPRSAPDDPADSALEGIEEALADLASRLGVDDSAIEVLDARDVTWRDGSVGCPEPGLAYTQAEVPGSLIVLRSGASSYRYHAADGGPWFFCENPQAPLEGGA